MDSRVCLEAAVAVELAVMLLRLLMYDVIKIGVNGGGRGNSKRTSYFLEGITLHCYSPQRNPVARLSHMYYLPKGGPRLCVHGFPSFLLLSLFLLPLGRRLRWLICWGSRG